MSHADRLRIARLAERLAASYNGFHGLRSLKFESVQKIIPDVFPDNGIVPMGTIADWDGKEQIAYSAEHALEMMLGWSGDELDRVWLGGALIELGDALARHSYFNRHPDLELVRHLRNAVAHGNRFNITDPSRLAKYPANNFKAWVRTKRDLEVDGALHGRTCLFDFIQPHEVVHVLLSVSARLLQPGDPSATLRDAQRAS